MFDCRPQRLKAGGTPHGKTMGLTGKPRSIVLGFSRFFSRRCRHCYSPFGVSPAAVAGIPSPTVAGGSTGRTTG